MDRATRPWRLRLGKWLIFGICASLATTVWVSYRAVVEWQRSARELAGRRAEGAVDLLVAALSRDMRAVQTSVLSSQRPDDVLLQATSDPVDLIASAFARYPYPEVFFTWRAPVSSAATVFYTRSDRYPPWMARDESTDLFPVAIASEPATGRRLLDRVAVDAALGRRYSVFDLALGASTYQVVTLLSYQDAFRARLRAAFGFMVSLAWVRQHYFRDLTAQVARIGKSGEGLELVILDDRGVPIVGVPPPRGAVAVRRQFPALFFDPRLVAVEWPSDLAREVWTTQAVVSADPALLAVTTGARRTLIIAVASALVLAIGLLLVVRAARANAQLADMRSEFVSTVTHELKTPISTIQAIGETFAADRGITPELSRKYGSLTLHEAKRLRRLVDNLLAYAHIADVTEVYTFERIAPATLIDEALRDFASQLEYAKFEVTVDVPPGLPEVRADQRALSLALRNIVDNAIRYSQQSRQLRIAAYPTSEGVAMEVTDRGMGIADKDLPHVTRKFFRGVTRGSPPAAGSVSRSWIASLGITRAR